MMIDALQRFRHGIQSGRFSLTDVARETGIPLTTLADMKKDGWGNSLVERFDRLEAALDKLESGHGKAA